MYVDKMSTDWAVPLLEIHPADDALAPFQRYAFVPSGLAAFIFVDFDGHHRALIEVVVLRVVDAECFVRGRALDECNDVFGQHVNGQGVPQPMGAKSLAGQPVIVHLSDKSEPAILGGEKATVIRSFISPELQIVCAFIHGDAGFHDLHLVSDAVVGPFPVDIDSIANGEGFRTTDVDGTLSRRDGVIQAEQDVVDRKEPAVHNATSSGAPLSPLHRTGIRP